MATQFTCTECGTTVHVPSYIMRATLRCPKCRLITYLVFRSHFDPPTETDTGRIDRMFPTEPLIGRPSETPAVDPGAAEPAKQADKHFDTPWLALLTAPHHCHQCSAPISTPIAKAADTITCPSCQQKTSAYAIQHRCDACRQTLESPTRVCGEEVACPRCHESVIVPWPVLHRQPADDEVAHWFWCKCPNCDAQAAVRKDEVGVWGACPSCLWPMQAPRFGEHVDVEPPSGIARNVRCPACQMQVPLAAQGCPLCGAGLAGV
jgi:hypothetical protein